MTMVVTKYETTTANLLASREMRKFSISRLYHVDTEWTKKLFQFGRQRVSGKLKCFNEILY
jgi:hypothetical protein